jgi:cell division protein FtsL
MVRPTKSTEGRSKRNARTGVGIRNSRAKKGRLLLTHRQITLIVLMLFVFMGSSISYVWSNFEGTQIGYDLSRLQREELRLSELNQKLRLELATLKSPQNLEEATRNLGLRQPLPKQIVILP